MTRYIRIANLTEYPELSEGSNSSVNTKPCKDYGTKKSVTKSHYACDWCYYRLSCKAIASKFMSLEQLKAEGLVN